MSEGRKEERKGEECEIVGVIKTVDGFRKQTRNKGRKD